MKALITSHSRSGTSWIADVLHVCGVGVIGHEHCFHGDGHDHSADWGRYDVEVSGFAAHKLSELPADVAIFFQLRHPLSQCTSWTQLKLGGVSVGSIDEDVCETSEIPHPDRSLWRWVRWTQLTMASGRIRRVYRVEDEQSVTEVVQDCAMLCGKALLSESTIRKAMGTVSKNPRSIFAKIGEDLSWASFEDRNLVAEAQALALEFGYKIEPTS